MDSGKIIVVLFCLISSFSFSQQIIRGVVVEKDSSSPMPFVYIINKGTGNGTMSDHQGNFSILTGTADTLVCSFVGYLKQVVAVKDLVKDKTGRVIVAMTPLPVNLRPVVVSAFKLAPYEREYMNDIMDRSRLITMDYAQSPITALYMRYSKEGRQVRKLAQIFENLIREEQVQKKLSPEILRRLTRDEDIDYAAFRKYCYYVDDDYIITHDGVELYSKVMDCYRSWKKEMKGR